MVERAAWDGLVRSRPTDPPALSVAAFTPGPSTGTFSDTFRVVASDRHEYFVKALDHCPAGHGATLVAEQVVAAVGRLVGAPVCATPLIEIPEALAGYEVRPGTPLAAGVAHGSLALEHADEMGRPSLYARQQDDNARRHVGVYALFDWCYGSDQQWLYDLDDDRRLYSHDHGLYLPGDWHVDAASLTAEVDVPHPLPDPPTGLSPVAVEEVAVALEAVTRTGLACILNGVPASWPVTDDVLEALGWFLEARAPGVAVRLRGLAVPTAP